jgi:ubiquinone/menaquinone biosynthesis C-methylase UbiE
MANFERGKKRWNSFLNKYKKYADVNKAFSCMDLGCGRGEFVLAGLVGGFDTYGIDVNSKALYTFKNHAKIHKILYDSDRCIGYDGDKIPFPSNYFSAIHSWYVLEHVTGLEIVLRELVRVTKPGGLLILNAQDARTGYEGHAKIPWIPFMPKYFIASWLNEFNKTELLDYILNNVFYITTIQVVAVLESLGCEILYQSETPVPIIPSNIDIKDSSKILDIAYYVKKSFPSNEYPLPDNDLFIVARK